MARWRRSQFFPLFIVIAVFFLFFSRSTPEPRLYDPGRKSEDFVNEKLPRPIPEPGVELNVHHRDTSSRSKKEEIPESEGPKFTEDALKTAEMVDKVEGDSVKTFKNEEVVFVTYASENHYYESREAIRRLRQITNATLIYYDLGLFPDQVADLRKVCNVRVMNFEFGRYPKFVKDLSTYAFKPILMAEMYKQYPVFWVIDASARFFDARNLAKFYDRVRSGEVEPFSAEHPAGHTMEIATHPQMYRYLPLPKEARKSGMRQALTMFVVRSPMAKEVIRWNLLCSLEQQCIAPYGASVTCSNLDSNPSCHRFDQSSVNIALCSYQLRHNRSCLLANVTTGAYSDFATVERDSSYMGNLPTC